jgi:hypothetical protein
VTPLAGHRIAHAEDRLWTLRRLVGTVQRRNCAGSWNTILSSAIGESLALYSAQRPIRIRNVGASRC